MSDAVCCILQVMQKLKAEAKGIKGVVVSSLLSASNTFVMARRLLAGVDLRYALQPPTAAARLTALVTVALLTPVYALAQKLVFSKVSRHRTKQSGCNEVTKLWSLPRFGCRQPG